MNKTAQPALLLLGMSFLANLGFSLSGFYNWTYDSWSHLFFASHYMHSWFNTWEPRWFGGLSVTSYPPLVTQLLALGGFAVGLERAYVLMSFLVMLALPLAMYCFSLNFLSRRQAFLAGLLVLLLPAVYLANYTYGQLPTLFALAAVLFLGAALWRYLAQGRLRDALAAALLAGVTIATHHFTFVCFLPAMVALVALTQYLTARPAPRAFFSRLGVFALLCLPLVTLPVLAFWRYVLGASPQVPVFHLSQANLFASSLAFRQFLLAPYLLFLPALPLAWWSAGRARQLLPLALCGLLFFLLGLGGTTSLPRLLFGGWWQWLTYDRFALWAGVLAIPLLARLLPAALPAGSVLLRRGLLAVAVGAVLAQSAGCAFFASDPSRRTLLPDPPQVNLAPLVAFLDSEVGARYRYITLGFGEAQMEHLSALTRAATLDGAWTLGRTLPILTQSGAGLLDTSKFVRPAGMTTLNEVLASAARYNLRWVLVNDLYYRDALTANGFRLVHSDELDGDSLLGPVTIWEKDGIPPLTGAPPAASGWLSVIWGIGPLLLLAALGALFLPGLGAARLRRVQPAAYNLRGGYR